MTHPAIEALLPRIRNGTDECDMAEAMEELRAVLVAAAKAMHERVLSIPVLRDHPANLTRIGIECIDADRLVRELLGEGADAGERER